MRLRNPWLFSISLLTLAFAALAQTAESTRVGVPVEPAAQAFVSQFQAAVRANDKEKIADLIAFPMQWGDDSPQADIKDRSVFLARYSSLFTPFVRKIIAKAKPEEITDTKDKDFVAILLSYHDESSEYAFNIERRDGQYRITNYDVGAY
jgi:hypothetical protein